MHPVWGGEEYTPKESLKLYDPLVHVGPTMIRGLLPVYTCDWRPLSANQGKAGVVQKVKDLPTYRQTGSPEWPFRFLIYILRNLFPNIFSHHLCFAGEQVWVAEEEWQQASSLQATPIKATWHRNESQDVAKSTPACWHQNAKKSTQATWHPWKWSW